MRCAAKLMELCTPLANKHNLHVPLHRIQFATTEHVKSEYAFFLAAPVHALRIAAYTVHCLVLADAAQLSGNLKPNEDRSRGVLTLRDCRGVLTHDLQDAVCTAMRDVSAAVGKNEPSFPGNRCCGPDAHEDDVDGEDEVESPGNRSMCDRERSICHRAMLVLWALLRAVRLPRA